MTALAKPAGYSTNKLCEEALKDFAHVAEEGHHREVPRMIRILNAAKDPMQKLIQVETTSERIEFTEGGASRAS